MRIYFVAILTFLPLLVWGQIDRQKLFNEERTMDRRYTLYQGQFRVSGIYNFDVFRSLYDENGNKEVLSESGISQNQHSFDVSLRYGILDYLDFEANFKYRIMNYRDQPIYIIAPPQTSVQLYSNTISSGFEDIYLGLNGRVPIPTNKVDVGVTGGIYLPSAMHQPEQPAHNVSSDELGQVITYNYYEKWGYGVSSLYYKGFLKFRLSNIAFSGFLESRMPLGESEGLVWYSRLNDNNSFIYTSETYTNQQPQTVHINGLVEFQAFDWVNIYAGFDMYQSSGGWTEEAGSKVGIPEESQIWLNPGFEVIITNKLWLRQGIYLPLSGQNTFSQFRINTVFYYNLFIN